MSHDAVGGSSNRDELTSAMPRRLNSEIRLMSDAIVGRWAAAERWASSNVPRRCWESPIRIQFESNHESGAESKAIDRVVKSKLRTRCFRSPTSLVHIAAHVFRAVHDVLDPLRDAMASLLTDAAKFLQTAPISVPVEYDGWQYQYKGFVFRPARTCSTNIYLQLCYS